MISVVMLMSRFAAFIHSMRSRYCSRVYSALHRLQDGVEPLCTGRCTWSQSVGSLDGFDDVSGEIARMRSSEAHAPDAGISPTATSSSAKAHLAGGSR